MKKTNKSPNPLLVFSPGEYPPENSSEVVICGRSNSGKSSLINRIMGTKKLAHTSSKPGKTVSINFYKLNEKLTLVDLPGYGYAKVPLKMKKSWRLLIEDYLSSRTNIVSCLVLCDVRRGIQDEEIDLLNYFRNSPTKLVLVFTKIDKLTNNELSKQRLEILARMSEIWQDSERPELMFVSSTRGTGIEELTNKIRGYA